MTLPPVIRIFFAIDLPEDTKTEIAHFIAILKKKSKTHAIRWTKAENLHVTLQFLPAFKTSELPVLVDEVRSKLQGIIKELKFSIKELHLFPSPYRPRVIVLGLSHPFELAALANLIGEEIKSLNYEIDTRPFRGHLTIGRIKHPQELDLHFLSDAHFAIEGIPLTEVVLFRSEPGIDSSKYTVLEKMRVC